MQKKLINILFLLTMLAFGNSAQAKLFNGEEFYLDNGLRVIVIPNHRAPIVKHMVWYKAGSIDEPLGKGGEAHLLEHLMFRGTRKIKGNRFNEIMEANGAESNAFTSTDMTAYHQGLDISRLELAMFLEADRMQNLEISDKDFALERDIVFQERKQRIDNNPAAYFGEALRRSLWLDHPYARPVTGMPEEILALTKEDVEAFYNKFYAPNNAVLVLSGDIDVKTAKLLAEKYYIMAECMYNYAHWVVVLGYFAVRDPEDTEEHRILLYDPYYDQVRLVIADEFLTMWCDPDGHVKEFVAIR